MYTQEHLAEYMLEIRQEVCGRCIECLPGGPPCAPLGKRCGVELNLAPIVAAVHMARSASLEPYVANFHEHVCTQCPNQSTDQCPCPMEYLLMLAVQAIEAVDERQRARDSAPRTMVATPV